MTVRNFWIEADIEGRKTKLVGGPRSKDGGFYMRIYQRDNGGIIHALTVSAKEENGRLTLIADGLTNKTDAIVINTER